MSDVTVTISISAPGAEVSAVAAEEAEGPAPVADMASDTGVRALTGDVDPEPLPLDELDAG